MISLVTVRREVEQLRQKISPKPQDEVWVVCMFPWNRDKPHGKYGGQKLEVHSGKYEAVSEEEELKLLRTSYAEISFEVRKRTDYWDTWEHFLKYHRCKCPIHSEEAQHA